MGTLMYGSGEIAVTRGMLGDPAVMAGFFMAGMWLEGMACDPFRKRK
jgi:hypothetical protein